MTTVGPIADPPVDSGAVPAEDLTTGAPANGSKPQRPRRVRTLLFPVLVLLGLGLVLALAPVAHLTTRHLPLAPNDPTPIIAGSTRPGSTALRNVPVGLPAGVPITSTEDVYPYAVAALGVLGAQELMAVLSSSNTYLDLQQSDQLRIDYYPYRYPALEPILAAAAPAELGSGATQLAAALIMLAGQPGLESKAAPAAFALLDRTRFFRRLRRPASAASG
jgi:cellulose synthase operon protein C